MINRVSDASSTGIASVGLRFPPLAMDVEELAKLRGINPDKYKIGLGCREMSLCPKDYGVVNLAAEAATRALERWGGDKSRIGLIAVGTESAIDMSRPLSAWVASSLGLQGHIRSYEVKHACYGGTLALRQALEWRLSGAARGKAALVVAADVALYEEGDPGEPTQGAGAAAFVIDEPRVATVLSESYPYSEPVFDFWRPVGHDFPLVDGPLSLECYMRAAEECFRALVADRDPRGILDKFEALCFHVPFPKMVKKAIARVGSAFGLQESEIEAIFQKKVDPFMKWNRLCGNAYSASLWISVADALRGLNQGKMVTAFSYGSGFGAELLVFEAGPDAKTGAWSRDVERDFETRKKITADAYVDLRTGDQPHMVQLSPEERHATTGVTSRMAPT